jgi:hypothetical protein
VCPAGELDTWLIGCCLCCGDVPSHHPACGGGQSMKPSTASQRPGTEERAWCEFLICFVTTIKKENNRFIDGFIDAF